VRIKINNGPPEECTCELFACTPHLGEYQNCLDIRSYMTRRAKLCMRGVRNEDKINKNP